MLCLQTTAQQRYPDLIPYYKNGKWGYCDSNKQVRIAPKWDGAELFENNWARVYYKGPSDNPYQHINCIINRKGKYIIPPSNQLPDKYQHSEHHERTKEKSLSQKKYPDNFIPHAGNHIEQFSIDGQLWRSKKNMSSNSVDILSEPLYLAYRIDESEGYMSVPLEVLVVDTSLSARSVVFKKTDIKKIVGSYLEAGIDNEFALYDTTGKQITSIRTKAIKGYIVDANKNLIVITNSENQAQNNVGNTEIFAVPKEASKANIIVDVQGKPLPQFNKYKFFWYIPLEARKLVGREDIVLARDSNGYEGLVDATGMVVFPNISFKYKSMDIVYGKSPLKASTKPKLPKLQGGFIVADDSAKLGYFTKEGKSPTPAINFKYKSELVQLGDDVFCLRERLPGGGIKYKIINSDNKSILPNIDITSIAATPYDGLYQLNGRFYLSDKGVLYADGLD